MNLWDQFVEAFRDALTFLADRLDFLGTHQWAASIILLTLIVRTALLPLAIKQVRSMQAMQRLQPEILRLRKKYAKDKQKLNQETMELYRREGVNPLGGCLPMVAQMPVLFAMYYVIRSIATPKVAGGLGITTMPFLGLANSCVDQTVKVAGKLVKYSACGLAAPASKTAAGILLLILMTATSYVSAKQMTAGQDPQQARIARLMPLIFVFVMVNFYAGLVLYWTTQNVYQLVQQTIMLRTKTIQIPGKPGKKR